MPSHERGEVLGPEVRPRLPALDHQAQAGAQGHQGYAGLGICIQGAFVPCRTQPSSRLYCTELDLTGLIEAKAHVASPSGSNLLDTFAPYNLRSSVRLQLPMTYAM